jgi:hypothetical protein
MLWLKIMGYWRKLHDVYLHKLYLLPDVSIKERKECEWLGHVDEF